MSRVKFMFASIDNGKFKIKTETDFATYSKTFKLDDVDKMARFFKQFKKEKKKVCQKWEFLEIVIADGT